eukprot:s2291_g11.t1
MLLHHFSNNIPKAQHQDQDHLRRTLKSAEVPGAKCLASGESSPVRQYSRAYLYHLHEVHELLGTMLLAEHNLNLYLKFFEALRSHIKSGTLQKFAAWAPAGLQPRFISEYNWATLQANLPHAILVSSRCSPIHPQKASRLEFVEHLILQGWTLDWLK